MPSPTSRQSCVTNPLLKIFDLVLTYCTANSSGNRHGPCVPLFMARAKGITRTEIKESVIYTTEDDRYSSSGKRDFYPEIELAIT
jgi:hypothetical protein